MELSKRMLEFANAPVHVKPEGVPVLWLEDVIEIVDAIWKDVVLLEWQPEVAHLEAALALIGDIAYDRDGYTSAEKLGQLVDELHRYARNPEEAAKIALGGKNE